MVGNKSLNIKGSQFVTTTVRNSDAEITFFCSKDNSYLEFWDIKVKSNQKVKYQFKGNSEESFQACQLGRRLANYSLGGPQDKWMQIDLDTKQKIVERLFDPSNPRISYPIGINCPDRKTAPECRDDSECKTKRFISNKQKQGDCNFEESAASPPRGRTAPALPGTAQPKAKKFSNGAN